MVDRYIYAVTHRLPEGQREEIGRELQGLIADMLEDQSAGGQPTSGDVEEVLLQLGHPRLMAAKYRSRERYLIGPAYFDSYLSTLKIVIGAVLLAMTVVFAIGLVVDAVPASEQFAQYVGSLFTTAGQAFFWVTAGYALVEFKLHRQSADSSAESPAWSPRELPAIPAPRERIKLAEPVAGIIFTVLFTVVFLFGTELLGIYSRHGGTWSLVSFIDPETVSKYLPLVAILGALGVLKETWKIIVRRRTDGVFAVQVAYGILSLIIAVVMLRTPGFWNPDFLDGLQDIGIVPSGGGDYETVKSMWLAITDNLIYFIGLIVLADIASEGYKWWKGRK